MDFISLENELTAILKYNEPARSDDMILYASYAWEKLRLIDDPAWLTKVFSDRRFRLAYGIATCSSVIRVRRKVQVKHPELRASEAALAERREVENNFKAYARLKNGK